MDDGGRNGRLWGGARRGIAMTALVLGLVLRLWWVWRFGQITTDTRVYGEFARNLLVHGVLGFSNTVRGVEVAPTPTLIRLPGFPLFLAACFKVFGMENYTAVMLVEVAIDLWTCLLLGGVAARVWSRGSPPAAGGGRRAGVAAVWLGALCPFMANYCAAPLTETLTLFCMAVAFYGIARWREGGARWLWVIGAALAYAILLRPEQGLLAAAVVPGMVWMGWDGGPSGVRSGGWSGVRSGVRNGIWSGIWSGGVWRALKPALLVSVLAVLPLVPWAARNWRVFHVVQPLAPRYATDPGQLINYGFQRWYRTWGVEFTTTETVYWNYDGFPIQIADLPDRAFDSNAQYAETAAVLNDYNVNNDNPTPALDAKFNALALERIHADPLRYYLAMPAARVLDMMFRPRTEMLPVALEWWKFRRGEARADWFAMAYAGLNLGYFVLAGVALWRRQKPALVWVMVATVALRVMLLMTVDNSEDRYTLEFFPVLVVLGAGMFVDVAHSSREARAR